MSRNRNARARHHHHVSVFYLAGFTDTGNRDGKLWTHDLDRQKQYRTSPAKVAHRRDFNILENKALGPDALENMFADNESRAAPAVCRILESRVFPSESDLNAILEFVTLLAFRTPHVRTNLMDFTGRVAKKIAQVMTSSEKAWDATVARMRESGADMPDTSYEDIRRVVEDCEIRVKDNDYIKGLSLTAFPEVFELMRNRGWALFVAPEAGPKFITSDHPVVLSWSDRRHGGFYGPGFALERTRITVALGSYCLLVGEFELPTGHVVSADSARVASFNSSLLLRASTLFSAEQDFVWGYETEIRKGMKALLDIRIPQGEDNDPGSAASG